MPVVERKLQRLFRQRKVTRLIKRCNDFGAGGVSVAIGELADGLNIDLDRVPRKYEGLDGTELAISESQERMAVVVAAEDADAFIGYANAENLEATVVAEVTEEPRLRMTWKGHTIVDISREFLSSNGAEKHARALVVDAKVAPVTFAGETFAEKLRNMAGDLNICCKKGLSERFDSTIGAGTVLMPFGGRYQMTPIQTMVAKLPVTEGETTTVSGMSYGFHPQVMAQSPYEGAYLSVVESLMKLGAAGFDTRRAYLTFQEYFERMTGAPERWGKPLAALLGALDAQMDFGVAAIGGKDSMSGTFENLDVPPTLVSFAIAPGVSGEVISPEFKAAGHTLCLLRASAFDAAGVRRNLDALYEAIRAGKVLSAWALGLGGVAEAALKMALGNRIGAHIENVENPFAQDFGAVLLEMAPGETLGEAVGETLADYVLEYAGERVDLLPVQEIYEGKMDKVFPWRGRGRKAARRHLRGQALAHAQRPVTSGPWPSSPPSPAPTVRWIPPAPSIRAGAEPRVLVINNLTPAAITESIEAAARMIGESQMIVLPGGFSGGDEPDGSAKFINAFFRNPRMKDAVHELLKTRDGLMLGICNGFQALIKLGLVPYGEIVDINEACPTLTFNTIGRHQSMLVRTRVASNMSPWLQKTHAGDIHTVAISHGEGRFVAVNGVLERLKLNGQIATQYVDLDGDPTMDLRFNPNGSALAIEGITSPDGRVLGKMGHTERAGHDLYKNVEGDRFQPIFEGGVAYFR